MHPTLRKRHRVIWLILAIVLPLLFAAAVLLIPGKAIQERLFQEPSSSEKIN